jgi:catechol 2,3-dioxygenase
MTEPGHVVFYVADPEKSGSFYREVVGLRQVGTIFNGRAAIFTGGRTHHELLLIRVTEQAPRPRLGPRVGLYHVGWKVGDSLDALREHLRRAEAFGSPVDGLADHTVSRSLYLQDPDGNEVELYVDNPDYDWRKDADWMEAPVRPLLL